MDVTFATAASLAVFIIVYGLIAVRNVRGIKLPTWSIMSAGALAVILLQIIPHSGGKSDNPWRCKQCDNTGGCRKEKRKRVLIYRVFQSWLSCDCCQYCDTLYVFACLLYSNLKSSWLAWWIDCIFCGFSRRTWSTKHAKLLKICKKYSLGFSIIT